MLERKHYKTKLCILYQRGHCPRQSCSFAHGDAELRRYTGSLNGRRDHGSVDLRDKLGRRHSSHLTYSPARDARGSHALRSHKLYPRDRGYSPSRSPARSDRRHRKKQYLDGKSDVSGSPKISDVAEEQSKEGKVSSYDEKDVLEDELKQTQLDIELLDEQKCQLETILEEKGQEAEKISAKIEELEAQLKEEQDGCRRITSKFKKFTKVHGRYLRAQEELKRWQTRLHRLGDELGFDASKTVVNEEDSSINLGSDAEPNGDNHTNYKHDLHNFASPIKKRLRLNLWATDEAKAGTSRKRERLSNMPAGEKLALGAGLISHSQSENNSKETEGANLTKNVLKHPEDHPKNKKTKSSSSTIASFDKVKVSESGHLLPSTSMAAYAVDELIEAIEMEEKSEAVEAAVAYENGSVDKRSVLPFLPPPPPTVAKNTYKQYEGDDDEDVDVEKVDAEMGLVDMNSEVDIE